MSGKKLACNIIGYIFILFVVWLIFSNLIPKMVINPQEYLYGVNIVLFGFGVACVVMGIEIKSCISEYLYYKYLRNDSK